MTTYRNLSNKIFPVPENGYYNLHTGRVIKGKGVDREEKEKKIFLEKYRVAGTRNELLRFAELNDLIIEGITPLPDKESFLTRFFRVLTLTPKPPRKDEVVLSPSISTRDVGELSNEAEEMLGDFTLVGMTSKGKVKNIIDGDTLRIRIFVSLGYLMRVQPIRTRGNVVNNCAILASHELITHGYFTTFICRIDGLDAAEHNTNEGAEATKILTTILEKAKNTIYIRCGDFDKYGRLLTTIYLDSDYLQPLNDQLLKYPKFFVPYDGGTKSAYMKNLLVIDTSRKTDSPHS
jgi:endonuclease YncB( thermonuclease family)